MVEIMEEDKVTIKEEISSVEDTCTVFVVGEDVKEEYTEKTENQGMGKHFLHIFIGWSIFDFFITWFTAFLEINKNFNSSEILKVNLISY